MLLFSFGDSSNSGPSVQGNAIVKVATITPAFPLKTSVLLSVLGAFAMPSVAAAQSRNAAIGSEAVAVTNRPQTGYEAIGIPLGSFRLFPTVAASAGYDDNLYASSRLKVSDGFVSLVPKATLRSQWARHSLNVVADGLVRRYFSQKSENYEQYGIAVNGQVDVGPRTTVSALTSLGRRVETRGQDGDTFIGGDPISYRQFLLSADGTQELGRFKVAAGIDYADYTYNSVRFNGTEVDLSFRDSKSLVGSLQVNYRISPAISAFVSGNVNQLRYPNEPLLADRDSNGYALLGGVAFGLSSVLTGDVGLGYIRQNFDNPIFERVSGLNYRASLRWNVTELTTITGKLNRSIQRAPVIGAAGIVSTQASLMADHELRRNIILQGGLTYVVGTYSGLSRQNKRIGANASVRYLINRNLTATLSDNFSHQSTGDDSSLPNDFIGQPYSRNTILLALTFQL